MKFSIIVPVYNTEKYINRCLDSILNQTYKNYELIIVNDGSTDNSQKIIDKYKINSYIKENGGPGDARNYGLSKAKGDYILFVDSDDYIDENLLDTLNKSIKNEDIIRFQYYKEVNNELIEGTNATLFAGYNGSDAFIELLKSGSIDYPVLYAYKREYYINNNFMFKKNMYHEDFGLIPLVIVKANIVKSIDFKGYYYVERNESITTTKDYDKIKKKTFDMIDHFDYLLVEIRKLNIEISVKHIFESFISNALINRSNDLNVIDKKEYINELKKRKVFDLILKDNIKRKIKYFFLRIKYGD